MLLRAGLIEDSQLDEDSTAAFREYCSFPFRGLYSLAERPAPIVALPSDRAGQLSPSTRQLLLSTPGVWFVYRGSVSSARRVVKQWQDALRGLGVQVTVKSERRFQGVTVHAIAPHDVLTWSASVARGRIRENGQRQRGDIAQRSPVPLAAFLVFNNARDDAL